MRTGDRRANVPHAEAERRRSFDLVSATSEERAHKALLLFDGPGRQLMTA